MNILYETEILRLQNEYELTCLIDKKSEKVLCEDDFYGDPTCGLISPNNDWAIMAGEHLTIWKRQGSSSTKISTDLIQWVHDLRLINPDFVDILIDPWSKKSAVWRVNMQTLELIKQRDFPDYRDMEYSENVIW